MKLSTSCLLIVIVFSFASCSIDTTQQENNQEVQEENFQAATIGFQTASSLINRCRPGYKISDTGNCRKVIGSVTTTTEKP